MKQFLIACLFTNGIYEDVQLFGVSFDIEFYSKYIDKHTHLCSAPLVNHNLACLEIEFQDNIYSLNHLHKIIELISKK